MKRSKGLLKRAAAYLAAGTIIATMLPMTFASAEMIDGTKWETISNINLDGFSALPSVSDNEWNTLTSSKTDGDNTYEFEIILDRANKGDIGFLQCSWFNDVNNTYHYLNESLYAKTNAKTQVLKIARAYYNNYIGWTTAAKGVRFKNIFGSTEINAGDRIRVTAYVNGNATVWWDVDKKNGNGSTGSGDMPNSSNTLEETTTMPVRMWLSDATTGGNGYYKNAPNEKAPEECAYKTVNKKEWNEISIEYTASDYTKDVKAVRIDNVPKDTSADYSFPQNLYVAGIKVERLVKSSGTYAIDSATGKCSGNVTTILTSEPDTASNPKVLIAAYSSNDLVGCNVKEYSDTNSYDFEISNAAGADRVVAYLWYMDNIEPKIEAINLKAQ